MTPDKHTDLQRYLFCAANGPHQTFDIIIEYHLFLSLGDISAVDFGQLRCKAPPGHIAAIDHSFGTKFPNSHLYLTDARVAAADLAKHVFLPANGGDPEFPIAAAVTTDEWIPRISSRQLDDFPRIGFMRQIATAGMRRIAPQFDPRVNVDDCLKFDGSLKNRIVRRLVAVAAVAAQFQPDHRPVADPAIQFIQAVIGVVDQRDPDKAEDATEMLFKHPLDLSIRWVIPLKVGSNEYPDTVDSDALCDFQHAVHLFGQ